MRKIASLLFLLTTILSAQISVTSTSATATVIKKTSITVYDSTYNYPGKKISLLIGQNLFIKPKSEDLRKFGYKKFIIDVNKSEFAAPNIYKHSKGIFSDYNALANRYFLLKNIIKSKSAKQVLVLFDAVTDETIHFIYNDIVEDSFPFLVAGYFKKLETEKLGGKYILRKLTNPIIYLTQGFEAIAGEEKLWEIDKVTLDDKSFTISYILKNDDNNQILVNKDDFEKTALSEADYLLIKNNYPEKYTIILNENVIVGMTKEACKYALGSPDKINHSGNLEQWLYKNVTLYFKDGLLSSYN